MMTNAPRWKVRRGGKLWWVITPNGKKLGACPTHAEAIDHADWEARTVTITLLPPTTTPTTRHIIVGADPIYIMQHRDHTTRKTTSPTFIELTPKEAQTLARQLLTHQKDTPCPQ